MSFDMPHVVALASGSAFSSNEIALEYLDRETNPFGAEREQFGALIALAIGHPTLREVRISMSGGNVRQGETQPIDRRARVLVHPSAYDTLVGSVSLGTSCVFVFVVDDCQTPFLVRVVRVASSNRVDGSTYRVAGVNYYGDRPAVMAFFNGMARYLAARDGAQAVETASRAPTDG